MKKQLQNFLQKIGVLQYYRELYAQRPLYVPTLLQYVRVSRWAIFFKLRIRMLYFLIRNGFKIVALQPSNAPGQGPGHLNHVVQHNLRETHFALPFSRRRIEHLIYILHTIPSIKKTGKLLSIGPRNEGDLILLKAHGFKDIQAIDLFSYSPRIQLMDMHKMDFPDNSFDILMSSWVVRYSYDIQKAVHEMVRVCKNGAHIAVGFSMNPNEPPMPIEVGTLLRGGLTELLGYFGPHVDYVYWKLEDQNMDETNLPECTNSVVFRIKK